VEWRSNRVRVLHQRQLIPLTNGAAEYADVTENVIKIARPVLEALKDPKIQPYFRSLSVRLPTSAFPLFFQIHFSN